MLELVEGHWSVDENVICLNDNNILACKGRAGNWYLRGKSWSGNREWNSPEELIDGELKACCNIYRHFWLNFSDEDLEYFRKLSRGRGVAGCIDGKAIKVYKNFSDNFLFDIIKFPNGFAVADCSEMRVMKDFLGELRGFGL